MITSKKNIILIFLNLLFYNNSFVNSLNNVLGPDIISCTSNHYIKPSNQLD